MTAPKSRRPGRHPFDPPFGAELPHTALRSAGKRRSGPVKRDPPARPATLPADLPPADGEPEAVEVARRFRRDALAALVSVARNERAPAAARAAAAAKLLEYSDGRPAQAKPITVADVANMTAELRRDLLYALLIQFETELPGEFKRMQEESYTEALRRLEAEQAGGDVSDRARSNRFTRGTPAPLPPYHPGFEPPGSSPPRDSVALPSTPSSAAKVDEPTSLGDEPAVVVAAPANGGGNVAPMPRGSGPAWEPTIPRADPDVVMPRPPRVSGVQQYCGGADDELVAPGGVARSVLERSRRSARLAVDGDDAFRDNWWPNWHDRRH